MKRWLLGIAAGMIAALSNSSAWSGVYADDMSKCLVKSASSDDQVLIIQWMFAAFALHPAVEPLSSVSPAARADIDRRTGHLFQRLITKDCRRETIDALKYEGRSAFEDSFSVFGNVAGRGFANNPAVSAALQEFSKQLDEKELQEMFKEAGLQE